MPSALDVGHSRASGIATPDGKRPRTLTVETWKKLLRLMRECAAEGMKATFTCAECHERVLLTVPHPTSPQLSCRCSTWIGR